jgi:hypothetical protein
MRKPLPAFATLALIALSATAAHAGDPLFPDIVEGVPAHLSIQNRQQREILRFTTEHINIGAGALQVRSDSTIGPCTVDGNSYDQCTAAIQEVMDAQGNVVYRQNAGYSVFHPDHNHWHQNGVADFVLRKGSLIGPAAASSLKTTYCLIDYDKTDLVHANNTRTYFDCNAELQGISVGWSDQYHHSTHGQQLDITGAQPGVYFLIYVADPLNQWRELDETNNTSWVMFELSRRGANAEIREIAHSACVKGITCGSKANK